MKNARNTPFREFFQKMAVEQLGFTEQDVQKVNPHKFARLIARKISPDKKKDS